MAKKTANSLTIKPRMALATFVFSSFNRLMWLLDGEYFIEFSYRENFRLLITRIKNRGTGKLRRVQYVMICPLVTTSSGDNSRVRYVCFVNGV
jgi:hypothetical protein